MSHAAFCALILAPLPAAAGIATAWQDRSGVLTDTAIPPAVIDNTLEVTGESVKARQVRARMTIGVMVNGRGPFRFMVDSGADRSALGAGVARQLALPPGRPVTLYGTGGSSRVDTVKVAQLQFGRSDIRDLAVPALSEAHLGAQGLLGIDALSEQRLMFDFQAKTITVQNKPWRAIPKSWGKEIIIVARRRKGQLIVTEANVGGHGIFAVVDSGSEVTIGNSALRDVLFPRGRKPPVTARGTLVSVTGQTAEVDLVKVPVVQIGEMTLHDVTMAFSDVPPFARFGLSQRPAALLGTDLLEMFHRVSLDFRNRRIRFLLRS